MAMKKTLPRQLRFCERLLGNSPARQSVNLAGDLSLRYGREGNLEQVIGYTPDCVCVTAKGRPIRSKTLGQQTYVKAIRDHEITFAIGPAGTGKTFLAVAMAVNAFRAREVSRIILTRPAVEAGEKLGFCPATCRPKWTTHAAAGTMRYMSLMGIDSYLKNMERGLIEVSPLAYMRGRTLDEAFIILDEAQNTTTGTDEDVFDQIGL